MSLEKNRGNVYAEYMTLAARNTFLKGGMIFALLFLLFFIVLSVAVVPVYPSMEQDISVRTRGIFNQVLNPRLLSVHTVIAVSILYSLITIIFIYFSFEKTQSLEILFVAFFALSFSAETLRLILPLGRVYEIPSLYILLSSRVILFFRCFGLFSLFAASVYATGFTTQRQRSVIMIITVAALVIAIGVPIDTYRWNSALNMISGYSSMFGIVEIGLFIMISASFFVAAWSRGAREFVFIGAGSVLVLVGRIMLQISDTWIGPLLAAACLAFGTRLICKKLHKFYMWL